MVSGFAVSRLLCCSGRFYNHGGKKIPGFLVVGADHDIQVCKYHKILENIYYFATKAPSRTLA